MLEPVLAESDYAGAFTETLARFRRRTMLVVLTDLVAPAVDEWLVPALPLILREHLVVVAGVRDPDVARWARGPAERRRPASTARPRPSAPSTRAAGTVARLRGLGATVVDARPGPAGARAGRRLPGGQGHRPALTDASRDRDPGPDGQAVVDGPGCPARSRAASSSQPRSSSPSSPVTPRRVAARPCTTIQPTNASLGRARRCRPAGRSGRRGPVTKPSIRPATTNASTRPRAMTPARRASRPRAWLRVRSPGAMTAQPRRRPGGAGDDDGGQLEQAVGQDQPEELAELARRRRTARPRTPGWRR